MFIWKLNLRPDPRKCFSVPVNGGNCKIADGLAWNYSTAKMELATYRTLRLCSEDSNLIFDIKIFWELENSIYLSSFHGYVDSEFHGHPREPFVGHDINTFWWTEPSPAKADSITNWIILRVIRMENPFIVFGIVGWEKERGGLAREPSLNSFCYQLVGKSFRLINNTQRGFN